MATSRSSLLRLAALGLTGVLASSAPIPADEPNKPDVPGAKAAKERPEPPEVDPDAPQVVEGVILKVEPAKGDDEPLCVTVNTAAVWEDYVRDQATDPEKAKDPAKTKRGDDSVATKGQPASPDTTVSVHVEPKTRLLGRFRSTAVADTEGAADPKEAARGEDEDESESEKPKRLEAKELKAGQFVRIEYRSHDDEQCATELIVLRPVGGPDSTPDGAAPKR